MLRLHTFGGCYLERGGTRLEALTAQRKALALLVLLAASGERGMSRDTILSYLWPDSDEERARTSLKQLVHSLRSQLQAPELLLGTADVRLNPAILSDDVRDFRAAIARDDFATAMALYEGPFLDGFYLRDTDAFERWVSAERLTHAQSAARAMESLAEQAAQRGDSRDAVAWWRRLSQADPVSARAATGLMRALDASGDRAAALQHARVYQLLVRQELGEVDPSVADVVERLKRGTLRPLSTEKPEAALATPPAPPAPPSPLPPARPATTRGRFTIAGFVMLALVGAYAAWRAAGDAGANIPPTGASLAVLPFANTSGDPADEAFSDGLTDELIAALGRSTDMKVAGRTSTFALKGRRLSLRAVADTLGVATLLEGSVRRAGQRLKVTAQLVNVSDNAILWADSYDRELRDIFAVQEDIARSIVAALRAKLAQRSGTTLVRRTTADPLAYELYLKGRYIWNTQLSRDGVLQAASFFQRAIERDSTFARAHAGLSDAYARLGAFGYSPPRQEFPRALAAARRALAIDSTLAEAHAALAHVLFVYEWDLERSEAAYRRAIALDPRYSFARFSFAVMLQGQGRFGEAIAQLDTARTTDPLAPAVPNVLGRVYVSARQPDLAIRQLREALVLNPRLDLAHQQLGYAYLQKGMHDDAIAAFRQAAAMSGPRDSAQLAYAYAVAGRRAEAERVIRRVLDAKVSRYLSPYHIAIAYAGLGNDEETFRWLDRAFDERALFAAGMQVEPAFLRLHADPRWIDLRRRVLGPR